MKKKNEESLLTVHIWAAAAWLIIWELLARLIGQDIILVSPVRVLVRLYELVQSLGFWQSVIGSSLRILCGFIISVTLGILFAVISYSYNIIRDFLAPLVLAMRSVPVAGFIILALIWFTSDYLSIFISFVMVFPIIYTNILEGLMDTDKQLLEMAAVMRVSKFKRIRFIYCPELKPYLESALTLGTGLAWKSGTAAEVIGIPDGSIGERLYMSKAYLLTPDLFAWTLTIIFLSLLTEKIFTCLLRITLGQMSNAVYKAAPEPGADHHDGDIDLINEGFDRLFKPDEPDDDTGPDREPVISRIVLKDISRSFGDKKVFEHYNDEFETGRVHCLIAPSGSGKTTMLRMIAGLDKEYTGNMVFFEGEDAVKEHEQVKFSYMFQEDVLSETVSGAGNVLIAADDHHIDTYKLIKYLGLSSYINKPVSEYSGGMKRRASLIRALLHHSQVLLVDEPCKGLESELIKKCIELLKAEAGRRIVIMVTHDRSEAVLADAKIHEAPFIS
ncbi:MAG: ATP-binding cassette domain-containing protein [Lachnospiraceae bacterium]|jgi:NitT/TauT family transport system permease protein|nr:ATP-binding cassette domain-containing protein [Lachnospiraceae bacterium]MEE3460478.1 ATP-binding cassette domain-containing protein [Lachnospiraceae bacterium]